MDDHLLFQLDAAAQRVKGRDHTMIDPVEFGEIKGAVAALQAQVTDAAPRAYLGSRGKDGPVVLSTRSTPTTLAPWGRTLASTTRWALSLSGRCGSVDKAWLSEVRRSQLPSGYKE